MGGVVLGNVAGWLLDHGFSYAPVLVIAGCFHVVAFGVICADRFRGSRRSTFPTPRPDHA